MKEIFQQQAAGTCVRRLGDHKYFLLEKTFKAKAKNYFFIRRKIVFGVHEKTNHDSVKQCVSGQSFKV